MEEPTGISNIGFTKCFTTTDNISLDDVIHFFDSKREPHCLERMFTPGKLAPFLVGSKELQNSASGSLTGADGSLQVDTFESRRHELAKHKIELARLSEIVAGLQECSETSATDHRKNDALLNNLDYRLSGLEVQDFQKEAAQHFRQVADACSKECQALSRHMLQLTKEKTDLEFRLDDLEQHRQEQRPEAQAPCETQTRSYQIDVKHKERITAAVAVPISLLAQRTATLIASLVESREALQQRCDELQVCYEQLDSRLNTFESSAEEALDSKKGECILPPSQRRSRCNS